MGLSIWFSTQSAYYKMKRVVGVSNHMLGCTYVLHGRCEDDHFVYLCHFCEELVAAWADQEGALAANFEVMDQRLVEIEHEAVA